MIRIFHVSDLHFGAEDRAALDWFAGRVQDERPDAVAITGDLTMRARKREYDAAADWLAALNVPMTIEPGNHDLPYFNLFERMVRPYRRYLMLVQRVETTVALPGVSVIPLKTTARAQWRTNWSKGKVSETSLTGAIDRLDSAPDDHIKIIACHHPLIDSGTSGTGSTRGGRDAARALAMAGAHVVLSGHVHDPFDVEHRTDNGSDTIRMIGAGTLSERVRATRPSFNELRVEDGVLENRVRVMGDI